jgi:hypothetical protein
VSQGTQNRAGARDGRQDFLPEPVFHARTISTSRAKLIKGNCGKNPDKPGYSALNRDKSKIIFFAAIFSGHFKFANSFGAVSLSDTKNG